MNILAIRREQGLRRLISCDECRRPASTHVRVDYNDPFTQNRHHLRLCLRCARTSTLPGVSEAAL
jgi:hypothetical protein